MDNTADLRVLLESHYPLIVAVAKDEERFLGVVRQAAASKGLPVWTWSATTGLARDGYSPQYDTTSPLKALNWIAALDDPGVFVFADFHNALVDPLVVRRAKELAQEERLGRTLVLTGPRLNLPPELEGVALPWSLKPPTPAELERLVRRTIRDLSKRTIRVDLGEGQIAALTRTLQGLSTSDAGRLVQRAALEDGVLDAADLPFVRNAKAELLNVDGVLELIAADVGTLDDAGGLDGIKAWLKSRKAVWDAESGDLALDPPRGVLLTGIPGCGKSLIAKTLAGTWEIPLLLLDPGRLYGPYVGESEERLRRALDTIDAMAPIVLWIDEIEKGLATSARGDGGVSRRLLGTFLRWMQERPEGVFLVATANDVSALPPELLRKGRFDEIFFVDLPDAAARRSILSIQLARRNQDPSEFDLEELALAGEGYSGAEIEAAIVGGLYRTLAAGSELTTADIADELRSIIPLSISRSEDVAALRQWAKGRAQAA